MAHLFRTSTTSNKKNHQHHNGNGSSNEDAKIYNHKMTNGQQSRRNTMHPRARDSVISTGCSDRSSSISDESFFPSEMEDHTFLMDTCNMESLMSFDVDEKIGEAWPVKCSFVVREIVQTEITYVQSLGEIIKGYLTPLYSHLLISGESPNFIKTVFCNIVKIHQTHIELMEYFQDTCMSPLEFVSSFLKVDFLSLYTIYCTSYAQGNECLERSLTDNPELREFIEQCQRNVGHSLPLSSQLIKPVQRILKYRLLLDELNKHFDVNHPYHKTILSALDKMSAVAEQINTSFTEPKMMPKAGASTVAKKRTQQLKDLQKSRSNKGRRKSSSPSPVYRCTSACQLNVPETNNLQYGSLVNGQAMGTSTYCMDSNGANWMQHEPSEHRPSMDDSPRTSPPGSLSTYLTKRSMPSVAFLRSYFENLEEETRRASFRMDSRLMKRASSMADTRRDPESGRTLDSPSPTKLSPKSRTRRSSLSLTDFKFQFGGGGRKGEEKSPSPPERSPRRSNVEDNIKRHIAEVRAKKSHHTKRTMV